MLFANQWAKEEGTYLVEVTLTAEDDDGDEQLVLPSTMVWSLIDKDGTIINSREEVSVSAPLATTNYIKLSGNDLALQTGESNRDVVIRHLVVQATYDSVSTNDEIINEMLSFLLQNLYLG